MRSALIAALVLACGTVAEAAHWELVRPGKPPIVRPQIHDTEVQGTNIGCVTLSRFEMRRDLGVRTRGHAVFCEEAATGEVLGALVNKRGNAICVIRGFYNVDTSCYDLAICDEPLSACRRD
jgi:hypothetical protein